MAASLSLLIISNSISWLPQLSGARATMILAIFLGAKKTFIINAISLLSWLLLHWHLRCCQTTAHHWWNTFAGGEREWMNTQMDLNSLYIGIADKLSAATKRKKPPEITQREKWYDLNRLLDCSTMTQNHFQTVASTNSKSKSSKRVANRNFNEKKTIEIHKVRMSTYLSGCCFYLGNFPIF